MTFEELPRLRKTTEAISTYLSGRLRKHLETLRPVVSPMRVLGNLATENSSTAWVEKSFSEFAARYREFGRPFRLPLEFDPDWVTGLDGRLSVHPWEYLHELTAGEPGKAVTMTSPLRWVVTYVSEGSPGDVSRMVAGRGEYRADFVRRFVVSALLMEKVLAKLPGLIELFGDLRFQVSSEQMPGLHGLPLATFTFGLTTFRPADELIATAIEFSGVPAFVELANPAALAELDDPFKTQLQSFVR